MSDADTSSSGISFVQEVASPRRLAQIRLEHGLFMPIKVRSNHTLVTNFIGLSPNIERRRKIRPLRTRSPSPVQSENVNMGEGEVEPLYQREWGFGRPMFYFGHPQEMAPGIPSHPAESTRATKKKEAIPAAPQIQKANQQPEETPVPLIRRSRRVRGLPPVKYPESVLQRCKLI